MHWAEADTSQVGAQDIFVNKLTLKYICVFTHVCVCVCVCVFINMGTKA